MNKPDIFSFEALGTVWKITIFDKLDTLQFKKIHNLVLSCARKFDETYSRFIPISFIRKLVNKSGIVSVPEDLVSMLRIYRNLYLPSGKKLNPLIGSLLSQLGYDDTYTLKPEEHLTAVPDFTESIQIIDDKTINLKKNLLIDPGALGKGYLIDKIFDRLHDSGLKRFLVDGSGDIRYKGGRIKIKVGLEHPGDFSKVIGVFDLMQGALCSSSGSRRKWDKYHHIIDPKTKSSPRDVLCVWVLSEKAAVSDALATALFFSPPENYSSIYDFEYCILNKEMKIKRSDGFKAILY
jgi:FAD:protein FMN transferase